MTLSKTVLLLLLLCFSQAYAQLSDDSLKKAIGIRHEQRHGKLSAEEIISRRIYGTSTEVCAGYFSHIKMFSFVPGNSPGSDPYWVCDDCPRYLYCVNTNAGLPVDIKNPEEFNREIDSSGREFSILDKSYFYLLLNGLKNGGIASPSLYRNNLIKNSKIIAAKLSWEIGYWEINQFKHIRNKGFVYNELYRHHIDVSDKYTFYIPVREYTTGKDKVTIHQFNYNKHGSLLSYTSFPLDIP